MIYRASLRYVLPVVLLLLAAWLRFHLLGAQSLWNDEGSSYVQATRTFAGIAENAARDIHPPGYYWLLAVWTKLAGTSEFALRMPSALASILTVAFTAALGTRLFGREAGLLAALFVTLNTFSIYYAQEARMYALLALWGVASTWAFVGLMRASRGDDINRQQGAIRWSITYALLSAAGLYTHYAFPFVLMAHGVAFIAWAVAEIRAAGEHQDATRLRAIVLPFVLSGLGALLVFAPWLPTALEQVTGWPSTGEPVSPITALATLLAYFAFGLTVGSGTTIAVVFFLLFALICLPAERESRRWWALSLPALWVALSVGLFLAMGLFRESNLKFLLPAQAAFALWMARGVWVLWHIRPRRERARLRFVPKAAAVMGTLSLLIILWDGLPALYTDPAYQRDDYRAIAATITANPHPDDAIILNGPGQQEVFRYYYDGDADVYPLPEGYGAGDDQTRQRTRSIIESHGRVFAVLWGTSERDPQEVVESTLDRHAYEANSRWFGDVRLARYASPVQFESFTDTGAQFGGSITLQRYALNGRTFSPGDVLQLQLQWTTDTALEQDYKVFVQLLTPDGTLAAQRDSHPGGGSVRTTTWEPGETITDNHALIIPEDLPAAHYRLIIGLYPAGDPGARLTPAGADQDYLPLGNIQLD